MPGEGELELERLLARLHLGVIVPAFEAERTIGGVLAGIPACVRTIIVVADGCTDGTPAVVADARRGDPRIKLEVHTANRGVGAAMKTGYRCALEAGAEIIVKMDSDGQMDPALLPQLVLPVALGQADYAKGNRFLRPEALRRMPTVRLFGNAVLSFVSKLSSGYWQILDPTNGYTAISRETLAVLDLEHVDDRFFFESSMLVELGLVRAVVTDVAMPARYGDEESHLRVARSVPTFAAKHLHGVGRRILYRYFLTDFSPVSLLLAVSVPLTLFGFSYGLAYWLRSILYGITATAGTVMVAAFSTTAGLYALVQALVYDVLSAPQRALTPARLVRLRADPSNLG